MFTYKYVNEKRSIRKFINKYNFIMKRARRNNSNTIIILDDETEINFSDEETEINFSDEETIENLSDEDYIDEENEEDEENYIDDIEPDNFILSDSGIPQSQESRLIDYISTVDTLCYIQASIRGYVEKKKKINELKLDMIMKIKNGLVGYLERKKVKELKNNDDKLINYLETMKIG